MASSYAKCSTLSRFLICLLLLFIQDSIGAKYGKSFTLFNLLLPADFKCLLPHGEVPVVRIYAGGNVDANGLANIENARTAGYKGIEVYVQPESLSSKLGSQQFEEAYKYVNAKFPLQRVWLLVTDPRTWSTTNGGSQENVNFIRDFIKQANSRNVAVGIYTSWYDWLLITNDYKGLKNDCRDGGCALWYWHTLGQGGNAQTAQDFTDFRQFGTWKAPAVKEYDIVDNQICGLYLNWSIFSNSKRILIRKNDALKSNQTYRKKIGALKMRKGGKMGVEPVDEKFVIGDAF